MATSEEYLEKTGNETLRYPPDMGGKLIPFMQIRINERSLTKDEGFVTDIFTYIPVGIFQNDGMAYNNLERGLLGAGIQALSNEQFVLTAEDIQAAAGQFTGAFQNFTGIDASLGYNAGVAERGIAMNPTAVTTFEASEIRTFDINLKFITNSADESATVGKIINRIREFMYPEKIGQFSLQYPATFDIRFFVPKAVGDGIEIEETPYMPIYMPAYCTGLQTTYNSTHSSFHPDGAPVEVDCQLSFRETHQLTREALRERMAERGISASLAEDEQGTTYIDEDLSTSLEGLRALGKTDGSTVEGGTS